MEGTGYRSPARSSSVRGDAAKSAPVNAARARLRTDGGENDTAFVETVLTQCIISGVVLLIILLMCLVKTDFTREIRTSLKMAISKDDSFLSAEYLTQLFNFSSIDQIEPTNEIIPDENVLYPSEEGLTVPGAQQSDKPDAAEEAATEGALNEAPAQSPAAGADSIGEAAPSAENNDIPAEMRIDEDILEEINSRTET
jgi:hypothetical protein